ncbi:hypothetical protein [Actinorugispora endophytica]|uniref:Uncharacterized protein n=1 Tax=Actinorugispora endophytica TaxID=1605990 RepID=A0A4R6UI47_9ACTN|nr:hypothetical protein [Actinorugispora endophytica]TDQ45039.1 hypothetical protein EV190_13331 [Actinorugispora endophytica]
MDAVIAVLSNLAGWNSVVFASVVGISGVLTWYQVKKLNQERGEEAAKLDYEAQKSSAGVLGNRRDASYWLTGRPGARELEFRNQKTKLESDLRNLQGEIEGFYEEQKLALEGARPLLYRTGAGISDSEAYLSLVQLQLSNLEETRQVLGAVGRLDESGRLAVDEGLGPIAADKARHILGRVDEVVASSFFENQRAIIAELKAEYDSVRAETERLARVVEEKLREQQGRGTPQRGEGESRSVVPAAGAAPGSGSLDFPGQLPLPLGTPERPRRATGSRPERSRQQQGTRRGPQQ